MSQHMRAAVLENCPGNLQVASLTVDEATEAMTPGAPREREVLVRTAADGLCHTDLHARARIGAASHA